MQTKLGPARAAYLAELPFSHRIAPAPGQALLVVHANPSDQERAILPRMNQAQLDESAGGDRRLGRAGFRPSARALQRRWHDRLLVDVASVGLPMDGDRRAAYAILTWDGAGWQAEHRRVF